MKTLALLSFVLGACLGQQPDEVKRPPPIAIISQVGAQGGDGTFNYGFEAANGIQSSAVGSIRTLGPKGEQGQVVQGSYSYTAPDGTPISAQYTADETGFHILGPHIPTPPPALARSLANQPAQPQYQPQQQPQYQPQYQPQQVQSQYQPQYQPQQQAQYQPQYQQLQQPQYQPQQQTQYQPQQQPQYQPQQQTQYQPQ